MHSGLDIDMNNTEHGAVIEFPVIAFSDGFDAMEHPFDAAERVLTAPS
jgi:hypothetical protein